MRDESGGQALFGLLGALADDRLEPSQHEELRRILKADPGARRAYLEYVDLHLALGKLSRREPRIAPRVGGRGRRYAVGVLLGVAASLLIAGTLLVANRGETTPPKHPPGQGGSPVLTQSSGARFF